MESSAGSSGIGTFVCASNLSYAIVLGTKVKRILRGVSFALNDGDMCMILGPSGAGKSSLLDLVAQRNVDGIWSGSIAVGGKSIQATNESHGIAYVYQSDLLIATLTVEETVRYSTWLHLSSSLSDFEKETRVQSVITQLGLQRVKGNKVFDEVKQCGLSGGERKRLSIATQIVADPRLILLDEPTSGLDSALAMEVMSTMRNFCSGNRTVLTTIHQPSRAVFALFDKLMVIVQVGFTFGAGYQNPAEFVLDVCTGQILPANSTMRLQAVDLAAAYDSSPFCLATAAVINAEIARIRHQAGPVRKGDESSVSTPTLSTQVLSLFGLAGWDDAVVAAQYARSTLSQCLILIHRTSVSKIRDKSDLRSHIIKNISMSVLWGLIFFQKGNPSGPYYNNGYATAEVQTVGSLLLQLTVFSAYTSLSAVGCLAESKVLFQRETGSQSYSPLAYAISQALSPLPIQLFMIFLLVFFMYFLSGLPPSGEYFFFLLFSTYLGVYFTFAMTMAATVWLGDISLVFMILPVQADIMVSLSGYAPQVGDLPIFYKALSFLNYARWQFEAAMINHWTLHDTDDGSGDDENGNGDVLEDYSFDDFSRFNCVWIILSFTIVALVVFYWGVLPAKSKLHKVSNAEDARAVLQKVALTQSQGPSILSDFLAPSPSLSLKEKLLVPDATQLVVDEPVVVDHPARLTVQSFSLSNTAADMSEGCCLMFRGLHAPALPSRAYGTDDDVADSGEDSVSSLSVASYTDKAPRVPSPKVMYVQGVSGIILPGEMCAIMGSSGAGKTSLLNILSQRKNAEDFSGRLFYNGVRDVMPPFGYVTQEDVHVDVMTVRESLEFAAELRLPEDMPKEEKARRVQRILAILLLQSVADSVVGGAFRHGISGGEVKRLSIGVELLHFPGLMFLDEPTTGLDSSTSLEVVSALRNLANQQRTIVMTMHQPSQDMFQLFDSVMIMAESRMVYFGSTQNCTDFYTQSPYQFPFPSTMDAAEYMIAVAGSFIPAFDGRIVTAGELAVFYSSSPQCTATREAIRTLEKRYTSANVAKQSQSTISRADSSPHLSLRKQVDVLLSRRCLIMRRNWKTYMWKAVKEVFMAIVVGTIWWQIGSGSSEHVYSDRFSVVNKIVVHVTTRNMDPMLTFEDRRFHYRERALNAYSPFAYWLTTWLPQVPVRVFYGILFSSIVYPLSGLRGGFRYFMTYQYFSITADMVAYFMFSVIAALCPSRFSAQHYLPLLQMTLIVMSGFSEYLPNMQVWVKTLTYGIVTRYIFQGLVLNELQDNGNLPESHRYIVMLGFTGISVGGCAAMLLLFLAVSMFAYYLALKYVDYERR